MVNIDNHKLMYHPKRVAEFLEKADCYPIHVEIGPTNRCNHRCVFCALDWLEHGGYDIDKSVMISALEDMANHDVRSVVFAGEGEPLLHKDISLFVHHAKKSGLDVAITTNGVPFTPSRINEILPYLSWIRFSVNAGNPEIYSKVHRTKKEDFDKVIRNVSCSSKLERKEKLQTTIGVQTLVLSNNISTLSDLAKICKNAGADNLQVKPYSHHPKSKNDFSVGFSELKELEEKLMEFEDENFKILYRKETMKRIEEGITYPECYGLPFFALIDAKGNVIPCNLFYDNADFIYGNLYKKSFSEIWEGEKRKKVIDKIRERGIENCRKGCRLDVINRYIHRLKNPNLHDNFI